MNKLRFRFNLMFLLPLISLVGFFGSCQQETTHYKKKQNVLFILVDDLGWTDLGYSGSTFYESPHIDQLSMESFQFTNAYSSGSVCSPTRAAILTGKHPARLNITDWIPGMNDDGNPLVGPIDLNELPLAEQTLPELMKANGYKTFFAGKWHLGGEGFYPEDQGFDENHGGHDKGSPPGGYYTPYKNPRLSDGPTGEYLPNRLTNESINFLEQVDDDPFLLYLSFYTVHTPIQESQKHIYYFNQKLSQLNPELEAIKKEKSGLTTMHQYNPAYASMVYAMDENVGRLIAALKEQNLYENTTIVFTSDNGGLSTLHEKRKRGGPTSVLPLRAGKGWLYEGGIRIPLLIKPAHSNPLDQVIDEPVVTHDLFPTICDLTQIDNQTTTIDGQSLVSLFESAESLDRSALFWHYPHYHGSGWTPGAAIRQGDWKLIEFYEEDHVELYHLANDISESNDLSKERPEMVTELRARLKERQKSTNAQMASVNEFL